jgi:hypothetical protein
MERLTALQWEYNQAIQEGGDNLQENIEKTLSEYQRQAEQYSIQFDAATDDLSTVYAQGKSNFKKDLTEAVTIGEYGINVDQSKIAEYVKSGEVSQEDADKWLAALQEEYDNQSKALEGLRESVDNIQELEKRGRTEYYELRDMVKETLVDKLQ